MAQYTYVTTTRTVEPTYDWGDAITNIDISKTPLLSRIAHKATKDIQPKVLEDSLAAVSTSNYYAEDAAAPVASDTARAEISNYCQLLMKTADVTDTQNAVAQRAMGEEFLYQKAKKRIELNRTKEAFLVSDQAAQAPTSTNLRVGKMAGASAIIATTTRAVASFTQANYDTDIATVVAAGGAPTDAYMDSTRKIAVDAWTTTPTRFTQEIQKLEKEVLIYHSSLGEDVRMHWHHLMPQDIAASAAHFMLLQLDLWEIRELIPLMLKDLPDTGSGPSAVWRNQLTLLCRAEHANLQFY